MYRMHISVTKKQEP